MADELQGKKIAVGDKFSSQLEISSQLMSFFEDLSQDSNYLHTRDDFARKYGFPKRIAHGNLLGVLVSRLVGMELPVAAVLIASQSLQFHKPMYVGDLVLLESEVAKIYDSVRVFELRLRFDSQNEMKVASGVCVVKVLEEGWI